MKRSQHNAVSDQQTELRNAPERRPKPADVSVWHPRIGSMLPPGWKVTTLGDLVWPTRPRVNPQNYPGLPFIGMEHVEAHSMRLLGSVPAAQMKSSAVHFQPSDVLYGRLRPYLNKVYLSDFEGLCSAEFIVFPATIGLGPKYLQYMLNSSTFVSFASHLNEGDRPRVDFDHLASYQVPIAPKAEQRRIVAEIEKQFTRLEAAVAALNRVQANLKRYRASVLKAACEGRLVPTEAELARAENRPYEPADKLLARILKERRARWEADQLAKMHAAGKPPKDDKWKTKYKEPAPLDRSNLPPQPKSWAWVSLEQLSWNASYGTSEKCDYTFSGPPVLRISNIEKGQIDLQDLKHASPDAAKCQSDALVPGDFLVIRTNGSKDLIGRAALIASPFDHPHLYASYLIRFRFITSTGIGQWVATIWDSLSNRLEIEKAAATTAGQYNLNIAKLGRLRVPLPPLAEQSRIVAEVDRRLSVIDELEVTVEANLKRASGLRQAILKRAFEGKLVPQDSTDEPASVLLERIRNAKPHESVVHSDSSMRGKAKKRGRNSARHS